MKLRNLTLVTLAVAMASLSAAQSKGSRTTYPQYNVTTTISNADVSNAPLALQSDNPSGPSASYTAGSGVGSFVGGSTGEYQLDLSQQNVRMVYLNFAVLTPNAGSPAFPVPSGYYNPTIFSRCYDRSGNLVNLLSIAAGTSNNNCSLRINFSSGGQSYSFAMAPSANLPSGAPVTGSASDACNSSATDGTGCNSWTITPYVLGVNGTSVDLIRLATNGKNVVVGSYSGDTFHIDLQR